MITITFDVLNLKIEVIEIMENTETYFMPTLYADSLLECLVRGLCCTVEDVIAGCCDNELVCDACWYCLN